jgi:hypothetical protein
MQSHEPIKFIQLYRGLRQYAEIEFLPPNNITKGMDGELWLNKHRKKTKKDYQVSIFPRALEILENYKNHPVCLKKEKMPFSIIKRQV